MKTFKTFRFLSFLLCVLLLAACLPVPAAALSDPTVYAPTALVLDRHSDGVLFEKNADVRINPASTTKIMTVLLAIEAVERGELDIDGEITVPAGALTGLDEAGSSAGIQAGEVLTLRQVLYCAMLASANEAANVIALRLADGLGLFAAKMTERAAALGCTGTRFANAHGLTDAQHYTTARDMGRIALEAMRHPLFAEICATADYHIPATNKSGARDLHNSNALVSRDGMYGSGYLYSGAVGIKTGHTSAAGYCLVSAASRDGVDVLALVFGDESSDACFRDAATLLNWTFNNHSYRQVLSLSECVETVPVRDGDLVDYVELCPAEDLVLLLPNDLDLAACRREVTVFGLKEGEMLTGPITPGAVMGSVRLTKDGRDYGGVDLIPASSGALILDRRTGEILHGKGLDNRVYPADATKLMTGLLAIEAVDTGKASLNDMVTVSESIGIDLAENAVRCGLQPGEQMTLNALLQCALITGADDAANGVAEYIGGSVPDFVAQMNARAKELGCADTAFVNAHGAYSAGHYTTARDFSRIAMECTKHDKLMRICDTVIAELSETNLSAGRTLKNTNALICDETPYGETYLYEDAEGLISGYNAGAGYCLVSAANRNGVDLLCLVFGGVRDDSGVSSYTEATTLFDLIFDNYSYFEILKSSENIASVDVAMGMDADYVNLRPATSITILLPNDSDPDAFEKDIRVYALENGETVTAPVTAGEVLGEVTLSRSGRSYGTVKLVASSTVQLSRLQYIRSQIRQTTRQRTFRIVVAVLIVLFLAYLVWVLIYRIKRLRYLRAVRAAERERALRAETAMRAAPELRSPGIRFFNERGQTSPPEPLPAPERPKEAPAQPQPSDGGKIVSLFGETQSAPTEAQADAAAQEGGEAPVPAPAPDEPAGDLLASALLVARLEAEAQREETPEEKAERDYFEEFFRPKK